jgi:prevent-host-death family protein
MVMRKASIRELKARLSEMVDEVQSGQTITVTRHNTPVAQLSAARVEAVHRGDRVGAARLVPALKRGTKGRSLQVLREDRGDR